MQQGKLAACEQQSEWQYQYASSMQVHATCMRILTQTACLAGDRHPRQIVRHEMHASMALIVRGMATVMGGDIWQQR